LDLKQEKIVLKDEYYITTPKFEKLREKLLRKQKKEKNICCKCGNTIRLTKGVYCIPCKKLIRENRI